MITSQEWINLIDDAGLNAQPYSGRGMHGAECVSVVVNSIIEATADIAEAIADAGIDGSERQNYWRMMKRASQDNMGRDSMVLYWPSLEWHSETEECAEGEEEEAAHNAR